MQWIWIKEHKKDKYRSIALSIIESELLSLENIHFFSLQINGDLSTLKPSTRDKIIDLGPEIKDFTDTCGILENMDLLISVDTSIVHVCGAIGRPCWVLLSFNNDWRWLRDREDSPWYKSLRLFRQTKLGEWEDVLGRVRGELEFLVKKKQQD